jgi:hypothetical protein
MHRLQTFSGASSNEGKDIVPASKIGRTVQKDLAAVKDRLVDEDAFKGIDKGTTSDTDTGSDTSVN